MCKHIKVSEIFLFFFFLHFVHLIIVYFCQNALSVTKKKDCCGIFIFIPKLKYFKLCCKVVVYLIFIY